MKDSFDRIIDYMRISITDRCNLRCVYCMPSNGVEAVEHCDILTFEEIARIVRVAAGLGVRKIRITGGEPLARKGVAHLISSIKAVEGIEDISLTTNAILLGGLAKELADSGLNRVNISLDSFRPERYREITRGGDISQVMSGIEAAEKAGLTPIKLNVVPMSGFNDDEIEDFARLTLTTPYHVRFIEFMPIGGRDSWSSDKYIPTDRIMERVEKIAPLIPVRLRKHGPARYYRFENASGVIGFISAITHHFCNDCNRLRITSDGKLRPCLFSDTEIDLKPAIRSSDSDKEIERLLRLSIAIKPDGHNINKQSHLKSLSAMSRIGG
ncbi:MAG: GTP 3',8-cyclase MoaA [Nitrospirota bacterium]